MHTKPNNVKCCFIPQLLDWKLPQNFKATHKPSTRAYVFLLALFKYIRIYDIHRCMHTYLYNTIYIHMYIYAGMKALKVKGEK